MKNIFKIIPMILLFSSCVDFNKNTYSNLLSMMKNNLNSDGVFFIENKKQRETRDPTNSNNKWIYEESIMYFSSHVIYDDEIVLSYLKKSTSTYYTEQETYEIISIVFPIQNSKPNSYRGDCSCDGNAMGTSGSYYEVKEAGKFTINDSYNSYSKINFSSFNESQNGHIYYDATDTQINAYSRDLDSLLISFSTHTKNEFNINLSDLEMFVNY